MDNLVKNTLNAHIFTLNLQNPQDPGNTAPNTGRIFPSLGKEPHPVIKKMKAKLQKAKALGKPHFFLMVGPLRRRRGGG